MRRLMLLRHAKTENDAPSGEDSDRQLDARGREDAVELGRWLAGMASPPDLVMVSTALRARQTWDLMSPFVAETMKDARVTHLTDLYLADPAGLLAQIRGASAQDPAHLMIIGHNPGLHELALTLTKGGDVAGRNLLGANLPTSGAVVIDFAIEDWRDVAFRSGELASFVSPKLLKAAPNAG